MQMELYLPKQDVCGTCTLYLFPKWIQIRGIIYLLYSTYSILIVHVVNYQLISQDLLWVISSLHNFKMDAIAKKR